MLHPRKFHRGIGGACGTDALKMATNLLSAAVCFYHRCGIGLTGNRFWIASVSSTTVCVTVSVWDKLGTCICTGKSYVLSNTHSEAVLGM